MNEGTPSECAKYTRVTTGAGKDRNQQLKEGRRNVKETSRRKTMSPLFFLQYTKMPTKMKRGQLSHVPRSGQHRRNISEIRLGQHRLEIKPISQHLEFPSENQSKNGEHSHYRPIRIKIMSAPRSSMGVSIEKWRK